VRFRALLALTVVICGACRSEIQLGDPDSRAPAPSGPALIPPRCPGVPSRAVVSVAESSWGDLRAIAVGGGALYALFARGAANEGVLARVPTSGGVLAEIARVGLDPSALALGPDGTFVFAGARGSSEIFRVDSSGTTVVGNARGAPSAIVADNAAGALWTLPADDAVIGWDFASGAPSTIATSPRATSLLRASGVLYIAGDHSIAAFAPGRDASPRRIADRCDGGRPAVDGPSLYCADAGTIARVDLASGATTVVAPAQPGARDVVLGAGRVFWRAAPSPVQTLVMSLPLDGIGGPAVVEGSGPGPLLIALDGCDLYFTAGRSLVRRGL
jgi:hypothetical protein